MREPKAYNPLERAVLEGRADSREAARWIKEDPLFLAFLCHLTERWEEERRLCCQLKDEIDLRRAQGRAESLERIVGSRLILDQFIEQIRKAETELRV